MRYRRRREGIARKIKITAGKIVQIVSSSLASNVLRHEKEPEMIIKIM